MAVKICTSFSGCGTGTLKTNAASIQCSSDPCTITECCDAAINNNGNDDSKTPSSADAADSPADSPSKTPTSADTATPTSADTANLSSCTAITVATTTIMLSCVSLFLNSFL